MIAAAYIRVSTEDQIEFSPDSQLKRIQEYARQHEIQIPEEYIFIDEGISGRNASNRPAFQNMIALARSRQPFQKILVWKFSRFARNRQDSIFYKSMLRKDCGIEVVSITEPLSDDPTSILIEALLEAMDEYYSINLAQEVRRGMQERFTRGKAISLPPFGYQMGTDSFEPCPEQSVWVRFMFRAYAEGVSLSEIAHQLNQLNIHTSRDNPFQPRSIAYILLNPVYIGRLRRRKRQHSLPTQTPAVYDRNYEHTPMEYAEGIHPPIIDTALWTQVQERWQTEHPKTASSNQQLYTDTPRQSGEKSDAIPALSNKSARFSTIYALQGLIHCSHCGRYLVRIHNGNAFQCSGYNHRTCNVSHYVRTDFLTHLVYESVSPFLPPATAYYLQHPGTKITDKNQILHLLGKHITYDKKHQRIILSDNP